jgi:uncharacterized membrane protein (DUF4010 family)
VVAQAVGVAVAAVVLAGIMVLLGAAFLRGPADPARRDATTGVAAMIALALGLVAGAGYPAVAVAGAAITTLVLATRNQAHGFLQSLNEDEVQAIARFAVISAAVLPFLPDAQYGPYQAWNPFNLWLVVVFVTGFSIAGYVANRLFGESRGTIATAIIGGAYSSTAVSAALSARLNDGEPGPFAPGIALATAVMYLRVLALASILAPELALPLAAVISPGAVVAWLSAALIWRGEETGKAKGGHSGSKPFELIPALGFLAAVAAASLLVRWAQSAFGEAGAAWSLFMAGSFDVDAATVTFAGLPAGAIDIHVAAVALGGTVAVNMAFKIGIVLANARARGRRAAIGLTSSLLVLLATLAWHLLQL